MRLMTADLTELRHFRGTTTESGYVGKKRVDSEIQPVRAQVTPTNDSVSIALYGERTSQMYSLTAETGTDIVKGDKVIIDGCKCAVISVLKYSGHIFARAERAGVEDEH